MKRLISLLTLFVALSVNAQVIHWITFIDTKDPEVGECDKTGHYVLYSRFVNVVNDVLADKGYIPDIHDYYDNNFSSENCTEIVNSFRCDTNDIVIFYYIGHGTHGIGDYGPFPQMLFELKPKDESKFIPLNWVHEQLKARNPALVVTIGMCCNSFDRASAKEGPTFNVNYGNGYYTETEKQAIQELFLGFKGDIIVASASPGQKSYACYTQFGFMDLFTAVLVYNFETGAEVGELDWDTLLTDVKYIVHDDRNGRQTPYFECYEDSTGKLYELLKKGFASLLNKQLSDETRMAQISSVFSLFSPNAVIKIIGRDNRTVVNSFTYEQYLGRLATNRLLKEVIPIRKSIKTSSDKRISEVKVKELSNNK